MAQTRGATGHSKPRVFTPISTEPVRKRSTTTKKKTAKPKATTGAVKKRAPATKKKSTVKTKVAGAVEKAKGAVEGKPAKKAAGTKKMKATDAKPAKVSA